MQLAKVIGHTRATVKHASLTGWRLLVAQPLGVDDRPDGDPVIAIDQLGSGVEDRVILLSDGSTIREMMDANDTPVRWVVMGIADE